MLSTIPSRRHSSAIAYSPRRPDNTIRIFSSAEYRLRVARRISRTCCSAVSDGTDFCLIFAPSRATMSQKSSLRKIPQSVSQLLTGNTTQIGIFHLVVMDAARQYFHATTTSERHIAQNDLNKAARTFSTLILALKNQRTGATPTVTFQNVCVSDGGQAIVG